MNTKPYELDLVDEMQWEDTPDIFITLEEAGLEDNTFDTVPACIQREYYTDES
jgi:hypothetical protein